MRVLKVSVFLFGGTLLLVVSLVVLLWFFPGTLLNEKTLTCAISKQAVFRFEPPVPLFSFSVRNHHFSHQKVQLSTSPFCVKSSDGSLEACFKRFQFETIVGLSHLKPLFESFGPIDIELERFHYREKSGNKSSPDSAPGKKGIPFYISKEFRLQPIRVVVHDAEIASGSSHRKVNLEIHSTQANEHSDTLLTLRGDVRSNTDPKIIELIFRSVIDSNLDLKIEELRALAHTAGKAPKIEIAGEGDISLTTLQGELQGRGKFTNLIPLIPELKIDRFAIKRDETTKMDASLSTHLALGELKTPSKSALPNPILNTEMSANLHVSFDTDDKISFRVEILPLEQLGLRLNAKTVGSFDLPSSAVQLELLDLSLSVPDFKKMVQNLQKTQLAIPAPLNDLTGSIELRLGKKDKLTSLLDGEKIPLSLVTKLSSPTQSFRSATHGEILIKEHPMGIHLTAEIALDDLKLQLPDLEPVVPLPVLAADPRIHGDTSLEKSEEWNPDSKEKNTIEKSIFTFSLQVKTGANPVRIAHRIFEPFAAFRANLEINSDSPTPTLRLDFLPMKVIYLKRKAELERLVVEMNAKTSTLRYEGRVSMQKDAYAIHADLGQAPDGKTTIALSSQPPLSEEDIISLILFNQLSSELDSSSSRSVQDTRSAISKRAIGFFSFWVLSSTPVETVVYDPSTQVYSARVRLPGKLTATVGSNWDQAQEVSLRKRIGGRWFVTAGSITDSDGETRQESMIEWYRRY